MKEKKSCNFFSKKASISYFEILTLIIASFAFCYIIYESDRTSQTGSNGNDNKAIGGSELNPTIQISSLLTTALNSALANYYT